MGYFLLVIAAAWLSVSSSLYTVSEYELRQALRNDWIASEMYGVLHRYIVEKVPIPQSAVQEIIHWLCAVQADLNAQLPLVVNEQREQAYRNRLAFYDMMHGVLIRALKKQQQDDVVRERLIAAGMWPQHQIFNADEFVRCMPHLLELGVNACALMGINIVEQLRGKTDAFLQECLQKIEEDYDISPHNKSMMKTVILDETLRRKQILMQQPRPSLLDRLILTMRKLYFTWMHNGH